MGVLHIALYSNDSTFLNDFSRELLAKLSHTAGQLAQVRKVAILQTSFFDGQELPDDLCVVDIRDDPERGMEFVRSLRRGVGTELAVVAPGPEYAMAAYDAEVLAYLTDPPDADRLARMLLRRFAQRLQPAPGQINLPTGKGVQLVPAERIVYLEYSEHRMILHNDRGGRQITATMRASFGDVAAQLAADPRFVRVHAAYIVNVQHVARFERSFLVMDNADRVPIAHGRRRAVREQFGRFFRQA